MSCIECPESIHLVGIGGIGMSALARLLSDRGIRVTGSDSRSSALTEALKASGIPVTIGHESANVGDARAIGYSTAIKDTNPEILWAKEHGLPVYHRSELLGWLLSGHQTVAVSGTHGKTTTSGLLATVCTRAGLDPLVMVGGEVYDLGGNFHCGRGGLAIVEADESDRSFLNLHPTHAIVTNIEADHLDRYKDLDEILRSFRAFLATLPDGGFTLVCVSCPNVRHLLPNIQRPLTYGVDVEADYIATDVEVSAEGTRYSARGPRGDIGAVWIPFPGRHYASNSLAAIAVALELGIESAVAVESVARYRGTARRFEHLGHFRGACVVDDYAHHPTEVRSTIDGARRIAPHRVVAVFQPHLFSRTQLLMDEFASAFHGADIVVITGIYAAREDPATATVRGSDLADAVRGSMNGEPVLYVEDVRDVPRALEDLLEADDLVLMMGAGDIRLVSEQMAREGSA
ncbi:MAG: UDP-N-acetylmuramate--L-alanine ligase [Acidobacteriota bacterium]|nr:UDP-N-acetylmuramate--L-alanine ligase [Acidobacteriota bacterium]